MVVLRLAGIVGIVGAALIATGGAERTGASMRPEKLAQVAQVRYIDRGLSVRPPHARVRAGKMKMPLYNQYLLQTGARQRASIGFRDNTTLHINQQTRAVLRSPHLTYVQRGEVNEVLAPGTNHKLQTAAAVASAIGTNFEVRVRKGRTEVIVAHGAVEVKNQRGAVVVKTNQETVVAAGQKPSKPRDIDAGREIAWATDIPAPVLGDNLALDANGGQIESVSSERPGEEAVRAGDGRTDTAWETAPGAVTNQSITFAFSGQKIFYATAVLIDGAAARGVSPSTDLKDFAIQYSNTSADDPRFGTLVNGTLKQKNGFTKFTFSQPIATRYLRLLLKNNYGSGDGISVAEVEVVGTTYTKNMFDFPAGLSVNPQGNIDVVDSGFGFVQRLSPDGKLLATLGQPGADSGHLATSAGLAEDAAGNIYVMNAGRRIIKLSPQGKVLADWGTAGSGPGQFEAANGVATDSQGNAYVADSNNNRIEKFSPGGQFLAEFKETGTRVFGPLGVAVDKQGNIYATDGYRNIVVKLSPTGSELTRWGSSGHGPGQFSHCVGIALDGDGNVYVADGQNNRVEKFTSSGQYVMSFEIDRGNPSLPARPENLAVDAAGNIYVSVTGGQVVQKYSPAGKVLATWR